MKCIFLFIVFLAYDSYFVIFSPISFLVQWSFKFLGLIIALTASIFFFKPIKFQQYKFIIMLSFFYLFFILLSTITSYNILYSFIQSILLINIIFIVFVFSQSINKYDIKFFLRSVCIYYTVIIAVSLVGFIYFQDSMITVEAGARRLRGVYGEQAYLAMISALNAALGFYVFRNSFLRFSIPFVSVLCLVLTGTRTFMISLISTLLIICFFSRNHTIVMKAAVIIVILGIGGTYYYLAGPDAVLNSQDRYLRSESITNLSGRIHIWKQAIPVALMKPLGSGYCLGGGGPESGRAKRKESH